MNGWVIAALLVIALVEAVLIGLAKAERDRERAGHETRIDGLNANILTLTYQRNTARAERDALVTELEKLNKTLETVNTEFIVLLQERDALEAALRPKSVQPSDGTPWKPRTRKTKPPEQIGGV